MPSLCGSAEATREWFRAFTAIPSWHAVLSDPGEFDRRFSPVHRRRHWPSPRTKGLGTPDVPAIRFSRGHGFRGYSGSQLLRPVRLLAPLYGPDRVSRPTGAFTSRLSAGRSPSPLLDMTTTVTGLFCWRDFHPQDRQLASLHWSGRALQEVFLLKGFWNTCARVCTPRVFSLCRERPNVRLVARRRINLHAHAQYDRSFRVQGHLRLWRYSVAKLIRRWSGNSSAVRGKSTLGSNASTVRMDELRLNGNTRVIERLYVNIDRTTCI